MLWLWCRLAPAAPVKPLARELSNAEGTALKRPKKKKKKKKRESVRENFSFQIIPVKVPGLIFIGLD